MIEISLIKIHWLKYHIQTIQWLKSHIQTTKMFRNNFSKTKHRWKCLPCYFWSSIVKKEATFIFTTDLKHMVLETCNDSSVPLAILRVYSCTYHARSGHTRWHVIIHGQALWGTVKKITASTMPAMLKSKLLIHKVFFTLYFNQDIWPPCGSFNLNQDNHFLCWNTLT